MTTTPVTARGVAKSLAVLAETSFGVQPTGTAQLLRRIQSMMNYQIQEIDSQEIKLSQQMTDARQGSRMVQGQISGELSAMTYQSLFANLFRNNFTAGVSMSGQAVTVTVNASNIVFGTSTNPLTAGFKVGDVIAMNGFVAPAAGNNNVNLLVTALSGGSITTAIPANGTITAVSTGQTAVSVMVVGKKLIMPDNYASAIVGSLAFEHWYADVGISELGLGCRMTSAAISVPPNGMVGAQFGFTGRQLLSNSAQQFTNPTPETTSGSLTSIQGSILFAGSQIGYLTGFNLNISAQAASPGVVGTPYVPDIKLGNLMASGSLTAMLANDGFSNAFLSEQEVQLQLYLTDSGAPNANFISVFLPRVKLFADSKNDSSTSIIRSMNFRALEQSLLGGTGLAYDDTTVTIQDSLAV